MVDISAPAKILIVLLLVRSELVPDVPASTNLSKGFTFVIVKLSVALATVVIPFPCRNVAVFVLVIVCAGPLDPARFHEVIVPLPVAVIVIVPDPSSAVVIPVPPSNVTVPVFIIVDVPVSPAVLKSSKGLVFVIVKVSVAATAVLTPSPPSNNAVLPELIG